MIDEVRVVVVPDDDPRIVDALGLGALRAVRINGFEVPR